MSDGVKKVARAVFGRSRHERDRIEWAKEALDADAKLVVDEGDVESFKELSAVEDAAKDAELRGLWLFRRKAARHKRRLAELQVPAAARLTVVDENIEMYRDASAQYRKVARVLRPLSRRNVTTQRLRRAKWILAGADAIGVSLAISSAFEVSPLLGFVWGLGITIGLISVGMIGEDVKAWLTSPRDAAALEQLVEVVKDDDVSAALKVGMLERIDGGVGIFLIKVLVGVFGLACVGAGVLRLTADDASEVSAAVLVVFAVTTVVTTFVSSWRHHNRWADMIEVVASGRGATERELKASADDATIKEFATALAAVENDAGRAAAERKAYAHFGEYLRYLVRVANAKLFGHGRRPRNASGDVPVDRRVSGAQPFDAEAGAVTGDSNGAAN